MITEQELAQSNLSYTNKDFQTLYPELIALAQVLTNRWDPAISNESDPGNVLLKLAAVVADKNNYNIDKNVLECFMLSATQESSMRKLTEMVGYNMAYYQSAITDVTFKYTDTLSDPITFNRFTTVVSNTDSTVVYTLIDDVVLTYKNVANSGRAIEGTLSALSVGDSEVITLNNLTNNRIYFPDVWVAENGIFICNDGQINFEDWARVDNLNVIKPLTTVYKFGYDSEKELPYIEFTSDIGQLIGSGLRISYIITNGVNGNITSNTLNTLSSTALSDLDTSYLVIANLSSATNGSDKEGIDSAYNNFKKTVGTFDTLVTTRDYTNAMYGFVDEYNAPLVSNAMATDRVSDINSTLRIVSYDKYGQFVEFIPDSAYGVSNIGLYPLQPYKASSYNYYDPGAAYDVSFQPLKKLTADGNYADSEVLTSDLDETKCIMHDFITMTASNTYCFKNKASLDIQLTTYAKVNTVAQAEIKANVLKALSDNFNARLVDYGYEIPYESLIAVIGAADSRIKTVTMSDPQYTPYVMTANGEETAVVAGSDIILDLTARNVLAGKLSLFEYDGRFDWQFGQTEDAIFDNIESMSTSLSIPISANTSSSTFTYTLGDNEVIQLIAPNLQTDTIYPTGVYYRFESSGATDTAVIITANSDYKLLATETLKLYYTDSEGNTVLKQLTSGEIIRPSFDMSYTNMTTSSGTSITVSTDGGNTYIKVPSDNTIETRSYVTAELTQLNTPLYWVTNNEGNILFDLNVTERLLDIGEYFIYSNSALDDLVILGAGTKITRTSADLSQWAITNTLSLDTINSEGLEAFTSGDWQRKNFTSTNKLTLEEMQVITLGSAMTLTITDWTTTAATITGSSISCDGNISYTQSDTVYSVPALYDTVGVWKIKTRLDINAGPSKAQTLVSTSSGSNQKTQTVTVKPLNTAATVIGGDSTGNKRMVFNYAVSFAGGTSINLLTTNLLTGVASYSLSLNLYTYNAVTVDGSAISADDNINVPMNASSTVVLPLSVEHFNTTEPAQEEIAAGTNTDYAPNATYIIPVLLTKETNLTTTGFTLTSDVLSLYQYNKYITASGASTKVSMNGELIDLGGLYMVEAVANWLAVYATYTALTTARPLSKTVGTDTVYPNVEDDVCKVTGVDGSYAAGFYRWNYVTPETPSAGGSWTFLYSLSACKITCTTTIDPNETSEVFLTIGKIFKINGINSAMSKLDPDNLLEKIRDLTDDVSTQFYYVYSPDNNDLIDTGDITSADAFFSVNNVANAMTLPQIDYDTISLEVASSSRV